MHTRSAEALITADLCDTINEKRIQTVERGESCLWRDVVITLVISLLLDVV